MRRKSIAAIAGLTIAAGALVAPAQAAPKAPALTEAACAAQVIGIWETYTYTSTKGTKTCTVKLDAYVTRGWFATQEPYVGEETHLVGQLMIDNVYYEQLMTITQKGAKAWTQTVFTPTYDYSTGTLGEELICWERFWNPGWYHEVHPEWNWDTNYLDPSVCAAAGLYDFDANGPTAEPWDEVR